MITNVTVPQLFKKINFKKAYTSFLLRQYDPANFTRLYQHDPPKPSF